MDRRRVIKLGLTVPAGLVIAACTEEEQPGPGPVPTAAPGPLSPTPACTDPDDETPAQTEGPFFSPNSPERADMREPGMRGTALVLSGLVLDTACRPVARALLDFWQADDAGEYDNRGHRLRAHQFSAADGSFKVATIVPGAYTGRTRHIHVKVQAAGGPVLTTQLYFPGEARNSGDGIFNPALLLADYRDRGGERTASFTFVLRAR